MIREGPPPRVVTLQKVITLLGPPNLGSLLHWFNREPTTNFFSHAKRVLFKLVPLKWAAEVPLEAEGEPIQPQWGLEYDGERFVLERVCLGSVGVPASFKYRLY